MTHSVTLSQIDLQVPEAMAAHGVPPFGVGTPIQLGAPVGDPGAFGTVYEIALVGGAPPASRVLMKVFDPVAIGGNDKFVDVVARTTELVARLSSSQDPTWVQRWMACPAVMGWCSGPDGLKPFSVMADLRAHGFTTLTFDPAEAQRYRQLPIDHRCTVGASFAARMQEFHGCHLLHTDLNPENVMVREADGAVQIIDLDAVTPLGGSFQPATAGKADEFMPPEVRGGAAGGMHLDTFDLQAESWSVGILLGYFLFGTNPLFFLKTMSASVIDEYALSPGVWPQLDERSHLMNPANVSAYRKWVPSTVAVLPHPVVDAFDRFRRAGTNGSLRPTPQDWYVACTTDSGPAEIIEFTVDADVVAIGNTVVLTWATDRASSVELVGYGTFPANGTTSVQVLLRSQRFELVAFSPFGNSSAMTPEVHGVPVPELRRIDLPGFTPMRIAATVPSPRAPEMVGVTINAPDGLAAAVKSVASALPSAAPMKLPRLPRYFGGAPRSVFSSAGLNTGNQLKSRRRRGPK